MRQRIANALRRLADRVEPKPDMYEVILSDGLRARSDSAFSILDGEGAWIPAEKPNDGWPTTSLVGLDTPYQEARNRQWTGILDRMLSK